MCSSSSADEDRSASRSRLRCSLGRGLGRGRGRGRGERRPTESSSSATSSSERRRRAGDLSDLGEDGALSGSESSEHRSSTLTTDMGDGDHSSTAMVAAVDSPPLGVSRRLRRRACWWGVPRRAGPGWAGWVGLMRRRAVATVEGGQFQRGPWRIPSQSIRGSFTLAPPSHARGYLTRVTERHLQVSARTFSDVHVRKLADFRKAGSELRHHGAVQRAWEPRKKIRSQKKERNKKWNKEVEKETARVARQRGTEMDAVYVVHRREREGGPAPLERGNSKVYIQTWMSGEGGESDENAERKKGGGVSSLLAPFLHRAPALPPALPRHNRSPPRPDRHLMQCYIDLEINLHASAPDCCFSVRHFLSPSEWEQRHNGLSLARPTIFKAKLFQLGKQEDGAQGEGGARETRPHISAR